MTVRKLDANGDLAMGQEKLLTGYSAEEVAQNVRTRLKFFLGEWFLNTADGTDWFGVCWAKGPAWLRANRSSAGAFCLPLGAWA
ncbi:hypothetical protein QJS63_26220 [Pseudomonas juntendi]|nr:hypothetical protein QJS63_26220 [Pseudomonas juntendi]